MNSGYAKRKSSAQLEPRSERQHLKGKMKTERPISPSVPVTIAMAQEDHLLTTDQAAELLAVSAETMKWWRGPKVRRGPPFIRVEGRIRYRLPDLEKYLDEKTVRPERRRAAPFYGRTAIEMLSAKHPGLREYVEKAMRRRVPHPEIESVIFKQWGEQLSHHALRHFYQLRVWPQEQAEAKLPGLS